MSDRHGPYRQTRFLLEFDSIVKAGFSRCHIPQNRTNVVEYREGTDPPRHRKLWGLNEYAPLVLENGVTDDSVSLFEWREKVERGSVDEARQSIAVVLLDEEGEPGPRWEFRDAWPTRYDGPRLDANRDGVAIERLVIAHEGMVRYSRSSGEPTHAESTETRTEDSTGSTFASGAGVKAGSEIDTAKGSRIDPTGGVEKAHSGQRDSETSPEETSEGVSRKTERTDRKRTERSE